MKTIAVLLFTIIIFQTVNAQQICKDYITDEWSDSRYVVNNISGDNVVTDAKTGLMWKQCSEGLSGAGCLTGLETRHTWQQAITLAEVQNISGFAGYFDWRLPNHKELDTLVARNCFSPSINESVFPNIPVLRALSLFWSSSPRANLDTFSFAVDFEEGDSGGKSRDRDNYVRLVRSGQ